MGITSFQTSGALLYYMNCPSKFTLYCLHWNSHTEAFVLVQLDTVQVMSLELGCSQQLILYCGHRIWGKLYQQFAGMRAVRITVHVHFCTNCSNCNFLRCLLHRLQKTHTYLYCSKFPHFQNLIFRAVQPIKDENCANLNTTTLFLKTVSREGAKFWRECQNKCKSKISVT